MNTICGIYNFAGRRPAQGRIDRLNNAALMMKPGSATTFVAGNAALGCRENGAPPGCGGPPALLIKKPHGRCVAFAGRIENRKEILGELMLAGGGRVSDATIVLEAFLAWGTDCTTKLVGTFTFAILDVAERRFLCVRDAIGISPFYYSVSPAGLVFASQLRQLLEDQAHTPPFCDEFFAQYLVDGGPPIAETPYRGIEKLPPGHALIIEDERFRLERYWRPEDLPEIHFRDDREYAEGFLSIFREAVEASLQSRGTVWAELSGGLDSSSIACMAAEILRTGQVPCGGFATVSTLFDRTGPGDPPEFRRSVIEKYDIDHHTFSGDHHRVFSDMLTGAHFWEEPAQHIRFYPYFRHYIHTLENAGVAALLSGAMAESVILSERPPPLHLADLLRTRQIRRLAAEANKWQVARKAPFVNLLWAWCLKPFLRPVNRAYLFERDQVPKWIARPFAKRMEIAGRVNRNWMPKVFSTIANQYHYEKIGRVAQFFAGGYLEKGFDVRYPFLYRPLVEYCLAMPYERKVMTAEHKILLRNSMAGILPDLVLNRQDKGDIGKWVIRSLAEEWPNISAALRAPVLGELGFVNSEELYRMVQLFSHGYAERTAVLSAVVALEFWMRRRLGEPVGLLPNQHPAAPIPYGDLKNADGMNLSEASRRGRRRFGVLLKSRNERG